MKWACVFLLAALPAGAEIVEIAWNAEGRFEREMQIAPGKFGELCGRLLEGQRVEWQFEAGAPLDFNIHHHVGKDVHYSEKRRALRQAQGRLEVRLEQDYCWMWTNPGAAGALLKVRLAR